MRLAYAGYSLDVIDGSGSTRRGAMRLHRLWAAAVATVGALFLAVAAQASVPAPVRSSSANEMLPAAGFDAATGTEFLTWSRSRPGARSSYDAYFQQDGGPVVKLNGRGVAWSGDVDVAQHLAVYQQARGGDSKIMFYDWTTGRREPAPEAVNTPAWEFHPRLQGDYLLFGRETWQTRPHVYSLMLFDLAKNEITPLDRIRHGYLYGAVIPGQVNGDWVVWEKVTDYWAEMRVIRYNLVTHAKDVVPVPPGRFDYGPSVTADGTVYFVQSLGGCGQNVRIRSFAGEEGETSSLVYAVPPGTAVNYTYAEERPDGSTHLLFNRLECNPPREDWNIYRLPVENVVPPAPAAVRTVSAPSPVAGAPWATRRLHH
jgi:hypothetical protein